MRTIVPALALTPAGAYTAAGSGDCDGSRSRTLIDACEIVDGNWADGL